MTHVVKRSHKKQHGHNTHHDNSNRNLAPTRHQQRPLTTDGMSLSGKERMVVTGSDVSVSQEWLSG